jgi:hypothetical protein
VTRAHASGLLDGRPTELAEQFGTLLWGNVMVGLLLGVTDRPSDRETAARAREATALFLQLHEPTPNATTRRRRP